MNILSTENLSLNPAQEEIVSLYRQLLTAWNLRSAEDFAALFSEEGNVIGFDGSQLDGVPAIKAELATIFSRHKTASFIAKVREVRLIDPTTAILRAIAGMVEEGELDLNPAVNAIQSLVAHQSSEGWKIILFQNTPAQFHGRLELAEAFTLELRQLL